MTSEPRQSSDDSGQPPERLTLRRPDDWHVHLRDGPILATVLNYTARQFSRAIVMPNLVPPVTTILAARAYRDRILSVLEPGLDFKPLMTCYLTETIDIRELEEGFAEGVFTASKLYPAHATTNSALGVTNIERIYPVLEAMQKMGMPLLIHGEVTDSHVDVFDREIEFIDRVLERLIDEFPALKIVFEHITSADAVAFVESRGPNLAATITPHHLMINRNAMFKGGIRPHFYCLPVAKRERDRLALRRAATSGSTKFFLGTDSAPHPVEAKESDCGCAGIFNAPFALEAYATVFEEEGALGNLEAFASAHGPLHYGLPLNNGVIELVRSPSVVPDRIRLANSHVVPFLAGETLNWSFVEPNLQRPTKAVD